MVAKVENSSFSGKFAMIHERVRNTFRLRFSGLGQEAEVRQLTNLFCGHETCHFRYWHKADMG
jgi:hypothetical protein